MQNHFWKSKCPSLVIDLEIISCSLKCFQVCKKVWCKLGNLLTTFRRQDLPSRQVKICVWKHYITSRNNLFENYLINQFRLDFVACPNSTRVLNLYLWSFIFLLKLLQMLLIIRNLNIRNFFFHIWLFDMRISLANSFIVCSSAKISL